MMKILVAGGAGFIGSHLVEYLVNQKNQVLIFDDFSSGDLTNIPTSERITVYECDISEELPEITGNIDLIYHLASPACPIIFKTKPEKVLNSNDIGTRNLLELAKKNESRFIFTSSSEIYGMLEKNTKINEEDISHLYSLTSRSNYVAAKRFAEELIIAYKRKYNLDARIVRLFNVYGPRMDKKNSIYGRVIPNFIRNAIASKPLIIYGDGAQVRSFCWIDEVIEALLLIAKVDNCNYDTINIGKPDPVSIIDLAHLIIELTNSSSEIIYAERDIDDTLWRCPDIQKAGELLNWKPKMNLKEGLLKLLEFKKLERGMLNE